MKELQIFTDGGSRGNPGLAACGVAVYENHDGSLKLINSFSKFLGVATNNQAEYQGVILALEKLIDYKDQELFFSLDSLLVVQQLKREYKVKDKELGQLFLKIWNLLSPYKKVSFQHIPREKNKEADRLVNQELDRHHMEINYGRS